MNFSMRVDEFRCATMVDRWAGLRVGFININDMYNNDVGKGGAQGSGL
jgi:hypothetical protein